MLRRAQRTFLLLAALAGISCGSANGNNGMAGPSPGAPLGTDQSAGVFSVNLSAPAVRVGPPTQFQASVGRNGQAVATGTVVLALSMPSMNMPGPRVDLLSVGAGRYEGAATLGMGGDWEGRLTITADGATGTAVYVFSVR